jgi:hypothetical protein
MLLFEGTVPVDFGKINKSHVEGGGYKAATKDSETLNYRVQSEATATFKS